MQNEEKLARLRAKAQRNAEGSGEYAALAVLLAWEPLAKDRRVLEAIAEDGDGINFYDMLGVPLGNDDEEEDQGNTFSPGEEFLLRSAASMFRSDRSGKFAVNLGRLGFITDEEDRMWRDMVEAYLTRTIPAWARIEVAAK